MDLRTRSRSKTPFVEQTFEESAVEGSNHITVSKVTTRSTVVKSSASEAATSSANERYFSSSSANQGRSRNSNSEKTVQKSTYATSDYSSEDGEAESVTHITQNQKNQIIEDAIRASNGTTEISALNLYLMSGRYWDKYPKTDWTYSPNSRDRVEIAPGVVAMPNMSRRTIHSTYDSSTNTDSYLGAKDLSSRSRFSNINQRLFSRSYNNNYADDSYKISRSSTTTSRRTIVTIITSFFVSINTPVWSSFYYLYRTQNATTVWLSKLLHHFASKVMLWDTWLLRKSRGVKKTRAVLLLCLLPLLLLGARGLLSTLGSSIYTSYINPSNTASQIVAPPPIAIVDYHEEMTDPPVISQPPLSSTTATQELTSEQLEVLAASLRDTIKPQVDIDGIVQKILLKPEIQQVINNYHTHVRIGKEGNDRNEHLLGLVEELKRQLDEVRGEMRSVVSTLRSENSRSYTRLHSQLTKCCDRPVIDLERHISSILAAYLNDPVFLNNQAGLSRWLKTIFVAKHDLEMQLSNLTQHMNADVYHGSVDATAKKIMDEVVIRLSKQITTDTITDERIRSIVRGALEVYDADKTGLVDYAMEPMGGQVVTTRCTESYHTGTAVLSILGIPIWYPTASPRTVISPGVKPGECWAFQNFPGLLVIKLANRVKVDAFSMEHVSKLLVPGGKIDSAPKEFEVFCLNDEKDKDPLKIGEYTYNIEGDSLQFFAAQNHGLVCEMVEIRIKSNYGNPNYTCVYRFRVHGSISTEPT